MLKASGPGALAAQAALPLDKQNFVFRLLATPLAGLYGGATRARRAAYDHGLKAATALPGLTLSVGNLVAGGTGKTPVVLEISRLVREAGGHPAILTRGYGGGLPAGASLVVVDGVVVAARGAPAAPRIPDEAALLSRALAGVPVLVGADRRAAASQYAGPVTHWILDDGFQHRQIARQLNLLLLDARHPFANGALLPRGLLREPASSLARATAVLFTRAGDGFPTAATRAAVAALRTGPLGEARFITSIPVLDQSGVPLAPVLGGEVLLAAGIADPSRLQLAVESALGRPVRTHFVPDHSDFDRRALIAAAGAAAAVLTTPKDYWRDPAIFAACARPVGVLALELEGAREFLQGLLGNLPSRS